MPGALVIAKAVATCPHSGALQDVTPNIRVKAMSQPLATAADVATITGCQLSSAALTPCATVQWTAAARVKIGGQPAVLDTPPGICQGSATPGPLVGLITQQRVKGI